MKKFIVSIAVVSMLLSAVPMAFADSCPMANPTCGSNGPIVPQALGGRFLEAGEEDCSWWFPENFGHACYTMRPVGGFFYPIK